MKDQKKKEALLQFKMMRRVMVVFLIMAGVLIFRQRNVTYDPHERVLELLPAESFQSERLGEDAECLYLWDSGDEQSKQAFVHMTKILGEMKVSYSLADVEAEKFPSLTGHKKVILGISNYQKLGEHLFELEEWVKSGGSMLILYPPTIDPYFSVLQDKLGIFEIGTEGYQADRLRFAEAVMIGGTEKTFGVADAYAGSLMVRLNENCEVYIVSDDKTENPILWRSDYGEGKFIINNFPYVEKAYYGFISAAYSLLGDFCAWPVINGSVFYLDDFPSPVPGGSSEHIRKDYGMDIRGFYTNVWWPDVRRLTEQYGIRYTGLVIEEYSDQITPPFERNSDVTRYRYFGNQLLDDGGEIGFHGYNHMPLVLENYDYKGQFDTYKNWKSMEDMKMAVGELYGFCRLLFPDEKFQVYVPPSNIISKEGRELLKAEFPEIKTIASIYFSGEFEYTQDFTVSEDGMIETPRIISGYILEDYMQLAALSELNFHYVNSHFQHPDDVLDEERGALMGWGELYSRLTSYVDWLYRSAPDIRNLTGTEMAAAVQRYHYLDVQREESENELVLSLAGFADEAWFLVRMNDAEPQKVTGGTLEAVAKDLYLLQAEAPVVHITTERKSADE